MKKAILAMVLVAGSALAGPRIAVGVGFRAPAPIAVAQPSCPGPGYVWVDGYYAPNGVWVAGFWRAPVIGVGVAPHFAAPHYFAYDRGREPRRDFRR
jgi:hypothetical protein